MKTISCPDACAMELITCVLDFLVRSWQVRFGKAFTKKLLFSVCLCVCASGASCYS